MSKIGLVKKLVMGFGFINGMWLAIGVNPKDLIVQTIRPYLESIHPIVKTLFIIIPIILTIFSLALIYGRGGISGALSVVIAFFAGYMIITKTELGVVLLIFSIMLGLISFKKE